MPWTSADAERHTHKADTPARQRLWAKIANRTLQIGEEQGWPDVDAHAIKVANAALEREPRK